MRAKHGTISTEPVVIVLVSYHPDPTEARRRARAIAKMAFGGFCVLDERLTSLADTWKAELDVCTRQSDVTCPVRAPDDRPLSIAS